MGNDLSGNPLTRRNLPVLGEKRDRQGEGQETDFQHESYTSKRKGSKEREGGILRLTSRGFLGGGNEKPECRRH